MFNKIRKFNTWYDNKLKEPKRFIFFLVLVTIPILMYACPNIYVETAAMIYLVLLSCVRLIRE